MRKVLLIVFSLLLVMVTCASFADSVTNKHLVYGDYVGDYTGSVDTNGVPFGFGVFVSSTPREDVLWHYIGAWENGLPDGEGTVYFENGTIHKGVFSQGTLVNGKTFTASGLTIEEIRPSARDIHTETQYIGNKKSKRFHLLTCRSVTQMSEKNKIEFSSREEAIENGYSPCGDCNP